MASSRFGWVTDAEWPQAFLAKKGSTRHIGAGKDEQSASKRKPHTEVRGPAETGQVAGGQASTQSAQDRRRARTDSPD